MSIQYLPIYTHKNYFLIKIKSSQIQVKIYKHPKSKTFLHGLSINITKLIYS